MTLRDDIVAHARRYIGVPFVHQGRGEAGLDCLGLLLHVATQAGLQFAGAKAADIDVPSYGLRPDTALLKQKLERHLIAVSTDVLQPADIVLLKVNGSPQHLAILSDYPAQDELGMIHAYAPARAVVEHRYDHAWKRNTYAAFRLPQLRSEFPAATQPEEFS